MVTAMKWRHIYIFGAARTEKWATTTTYTQNKRIRDEEAAQLAAEACTKLQQREVPDVHTSSDKRQP